MLQHTGKKLTFDEVFEIWRKIEEGLDHWKTFWKLKGYPSWEAWRQATHANLHGPELSWGLYRASNSPWEVSDWRGGMFHSWDTWFYNNFPERPPKFRDLVQHPGVHNHYYIRDIARSFPASTTITAIRLPNSDILVVEGMHRCCALTLRVPVEQTIRTELLVALADWPFGDPPKLGHWR